MPVVSTPFQRETADRPASSPARYPSRVSPRGVLMAMPVMTIRSALDKVNLHDSKSTDDSIAQNLPGADCSEVIGLNPRGYDFKQLAGSDFRKKCRMMNANSPQRSRGAAFQNMNQTQAELPDGFQLKHPWINGLTRKVSLEHRVARMNGSHAANLRVRRIDVGNPVYEEKRLPMRDHGFNLTAVEIQRL